MTSEHILIAVIVALVVLAVIAYMVKDRLSGFTIKTGNSEASITANAPNVRPPGVDVSEVDAAKDVTAVDQTGAGVKAAKVKTGGEAIFRNEDPTKNG
jgi:GH25 family lysozyme M1 (1,4-beta-N-acetylmuramidase)